MRINWLKTIWTKGQHNAFTDLCRFKNALACCFREATNHISANGKIRVLILDEHGQETYQTSVSIKGADLRDPKLSVTPDGKLLLLAYARHANENNQTRFSQPMTWFSGDGKSWSNAKPIADKNWWLWRLKWHDGIAHGFAYNRRMQCLRMYSGQPRRTFELINEQALSYEQHGLGYPNESDMIFLQDHTAVSLVRRDADSCTAQIGLAKPPYKVWQWRDLGEYIGGPVMLKINDEFALVAGRLWNNNGPITALWQLDIKQAKITLLGELPSSGDNSYPGLVAIDDQIFVSYYSSHQQQKSCIYLANIDLNLSNKIKQ